MDQNLQELLEKLRCLSEKTLSTVSDAAGYVEQRTEEASISRHLEQEIDDLEDQADLQLYRIGLMVYGTHTGSPTESEVLLNKLEEIDGLYAQIAELETLMGRQPTPAACPDCGKEFREGDVFCRDCGRKL